MQLCLWIRPESCHSREMQFEVVFFESGSGRGVGLGVVLFFRLSPLQTAYLGENEFKIHLFHAAALRSFSSACFLFELLVLLFWTPLLLK